jgi:hypothetical protein
MFAENASRVSFCWTSLRDGSFGDDHEEHLASEPGATAFLIVRVTGRTERMRITIECEPGESAECDCCGGLTTSLTRFVYRDSDAYAAYYAAFSDNHADGIVSVLIGMGEWADDAPPEGRVAFAAQIRTTQGEYQVMIVDRDRSPWKDVTYLGRILDRQEALAHPLVTEVFHLTDHIVHDDSEVHEYLERVAG